MTHAAAPLAPPREPRLPILLLALIFTGTVATMLLWRGPFLWAVQQPDAWQGAIEALLLLALVVGALRVRWPIGWRIALLGVPIALYLRRHNVDGVLLASFGYLEGLLLLGALVLRAAREDMARDDAWLRASIAGVAAMCALLWIAQALDFGAPRTQRLLALVLLLPLLCWQWRRLQSVTLLRAAFATQTGIAQFWSACLIVTPLVLFARSNTVFDFDSVWYGFRPEHVLVGERSVFEPLGLSSPVYYFPKLYEVLLLPLSATRELSAVQGLAIGMGALLARFAFGFVRALGHSVAWALACATVILSVPALANSTLSAKPDLLVALLAVAMVWFGWCIRVEGRRADVVWLFTCAALAVSAKLLAFPYVGVAGLVGLLALRTPVRRLAAPGAWCAAWMVLALATVVALLVCARTFVLAGMPTVGPEPLVALWRWLGWDFRVPVGTLRWMYPQVWADVPRLLVGWLGSPSEFSHLQISWPGNVWVFLPLLALLLPRGTAAQPSRLMLWALPATGLAMLLAIRFSNEGGDGNYFIAPMVIATILGIDLVARRSAALTATLCAALAMFVGLHASYAFVSAGWGAGTRAWDIEFDRGLRDSAAFDARKIQEQHLDGVAFWLHGQGGKLHVVGDVDASAGFRLPARYEPLSDMIWSNPRHSGTVDAFREFMACSAVEMVLLPIPMPDTTLEPLPIVWSIEILRWADALPLEHEVYRDAEWRLMRVDGALPACKVRH